MDCVINVSCILVQSSCKFQFVQFVQVCILVCPVLCIVSSTVVSHVIANIIISINESHCIVIVPFYYNEITAIDWLVRKGASLSQ